MRNIAAFPLCAAVAVVVAASPAHATVVSVPSLEEMAVASDVVAEIEVGDARVLNEGGRIVTLTDLVVKQAIKGKHAPGDVVVVYQLGGTLDGHNAWIAGAHRFVKGEHLVVFAVESLQKAKYGPNTVVPYGMGFGLFQIVERTDGLTGASVQEIVGDVVTIDGKTPEQRRYQSLASFEETIKAAVAMKPTPEVPTRKKLQPTMKVAR